MEGSRVRLGGLGTASLNGLEGNIVGPQQANGRWRVRLAGAGAGAAATASSQASADGSEARVVAVKTANLELLFAPSAVEHLGTASGGSKAQSGPGTRLLFSSGSLVHL